ncbi:hypothetical protein TNCV_3585271 [Trichonephila clavipes]|nr:hypothetical protein TNCV_3585271 [Trichonephila clavipes]
MINLPCRFLDGGVEEKQKKRISRAKKTDTTSLRIMNPSFSGVDYQRLQRPETLSFCTRKERKKKKTFKATPEMGLHCVLDFNLILLTFSPGWAAFQLHEDAQLRNIQLAEESKRQRGQ